MSYLTIEHFLQNKLRELKIVVLGDVMVDRYITGEVTRISPEAPVPINRVKNIKSVLGGAANVANNLSKLGVKVYLAGLVGTDYYGDLFHKLLHEEDIDDSLIIDKYGYDTITKVRVMDSKQQMLRLDYEQIIDLEEEYQDLLLLQLENKLQLGIDGIVISDYGKGFLTPEFTQKIIQLANKYNIISVVDPKGNNWDKYSGATYITPNIKELSDFIGYKVKNDNSSVVEVAKKIKNQLDIKNIVATRSEQGISLINKNGIWHAPAVEQTVYDVSGAGDTVVATLVCAMASNLSNREALWLCNMAAGIVVKQVGTYPIHRQELIDLLKSYRQKNRITSEAIDIDEMQKMVTLWKDEGHTIVFTNGCFDLLHRGHITYLKKAALLGDKFIIAINSDHSVKRLKGQARPINTELDRAFLLNNLAFVDGVVIFNEDTPYETLQKLKPNILVKGGDYKAEDVVGKDLVDEVVIIPFEKGYSTTNIIDKILRMEE